MHKQRYDPAIHNRRSMRLPAYDYSSNGAYFVTICLQEREPLLMSPELHKILEDTWNTLPQRFPSVVLDDFIIMPDHVHFIVWLTPHEESCPTAGCLGPLPRNWPTPLGIVRQPSGRGSQSPMRHTSWRLRPCLARRARWDRPPKPNPIFRRESRG